MSLVPVYIYEEGGDELPNEGDYFVVANNGVFMHKDTGIVKGLVKVPLTDIPMLGTLKTKVHLSLPKFPADQFSKCLQFFRAVWHKHHSEAAVVLYFNPTTKEYYLRCPKQSVSGASVRYGVFDNVPDPEELTFVREMRGKGFRQVGTIHSHCNFNAYHSGVDTADEARFDGIHLTIGHVDRENFSVAASVVVNDNRFRISPERFVSALVGQTIDQPKWRSYETTDFYQLNLTLIEEEEKIAFEKIIENEWLPKVSLETCTYTSYNGYNPATQNTSYLYKSNDCWEEEDWKNDPEIHVSAMAPRLSLKLKTEVNPLAAERYLKKVKSYARALKHYAIKIPTARIHQLVETLRGFFRKEKITDEDIKFAVEINPKNAMLYEQKGYPVHEKVES